MDNTMIEIQKADGTIENVTLVTYLISNDGLSQYIILRMKYKVMRKIMLFIFLRFLVMMEL